VQALQHREEAIANWEQAKVDARAAGVSPAMGGQTAIDAGITDADLIIEIHPALAP
jgi:hypothetical protein